jgi:hypothetical protein
LIEVNTIGCAGVPTALKAPLINKSAEELSNLTTTPGSIVKVLPEEILTPELHIMYGLPEVVNVVDVEIVPHKFVSASAIFGTDSRKIRKAMAMDAAIL